MDEIRELLRLWTDQGRSSRDVKDIAERHIADLDQRARQLTEMADALRHLAAACEGDGRPDCPIIAGLETGPSRPGEPAKRRAMSPRLPQAQG
jgi:MerR family gold-responsive transcriptional activator of gol and ges genes